MEKQHTAKEMQDYITARECLIMVQGWCNDIRNHSTNHQDIELIGFYMKSLSRLINDIHIGGQEVTGVIEKYAPLIKNDQLNMNFIRNELSRPYQVPATTPPTK
ncbi:MAG: hypothetical protein LBQ28_08185 [Prevotellaceae bacterium]|jgi:hypothetical protein|nr:hypothetical protein [Prevotellaceae bacterium]